MKPPDRLFHDFGVLGFLVKLWLVLPIALAAFLGIVLPAVSNVLEPWNPLARVVSGGAQVLVALLVIVAGGKLFVSLFQIARNGQERIILALPWLFSAEEIHQARKKTRLGL